MDTPIRKLPDGTYTDRRGRLFASMVDPAGNICEVMINTNRGNKAEDRDHGYRAVITATMTTEGWLPMHPPIGHSAESWDVHIKKEIESRRAVHRANEPIPSPSEMEMATAAVAQLRQDVIAAKRAAK